MKKSPAWMRFSTTGVDGIAHNFVDKFQEALSRLRLPGLVIFSSGNTHGLPDIDAWLRPAKQDVLPGLVLSA
ncbi:MAG: hypothetical protein Q4B94_10495 [Pseudomonadota bacterium]|nr:hypothetical protein [Pseudomonadota bacterium]